METQLASVQCRAHPSLVVFGLLLYPCEQKRSHSNARSSPAPSPACRPCGGSSWRRRGPCPSSAPDAPADHHHQQAPRCSETTLVNTAVTSPEDSCAHLSEGSSANHLQRLKVLQAQPGAFEAQELRLFPGVLRAAQAFLQRDGGSFRDGRARNATRQEHKRRFRGRTADIFSYTTVPAIL